MFAGDESLRSQTLLDNSDLSASSTCTHFIDQPNDEDLEYEKKLKLCDRNHIAMTTRYEIWAWYLFQAAGAPSYTIVYTLIYPIYLLSLSTQFACLHNTPFECDYYNHPINDSSSKLFVYIGEWALKPESYATLMISLSGACQLIVYLWLSSIADYSNYQYYLFRISSILGAILTILWYFINGDKYWLFIGIYGAVILVPNGLAGVFSNAYLPILVENHWLIRRLDRKYKSNKFNIKCKDYEERKKKLLRTIQDDMSQFGQIFANIIGFITTIMAGVGLYLLDNTTTEIMTNYGITTNDNHLARAVHTINTINTLNDEYWMKPIKEIDIWHSNIINHAHNISSSYIHGMRFCYDRIDLNGSIYGVTNTSQFIYNNNSINVSFVHSNFVIAEQYSIVQINLYKNQDNGILNGIQFVTNNNNNYNYNNTYNNDEEIIQKIIIKPDKYPNYGLSGYQVTTAVYNDNLLSMPIICGYSFGFMDIDQGQYGNNFSDRLLFALCGVFTLILASPAYIFLKSRKKPAVPKTSSLCTVSIKDYYKTVCHASSYPNLVRCLMSWFLWSDALGTTLNLGVIFADVLLNMNSFQILLLLLEVQLLAGSGALFFIWVSKKFDITNKKFLLFHLYTQTILPLYAIFGLFKWSPIGLVHVWEMYVMVGLILGTQFGSMYALGSSLYAHLIPIGYESQFYGLYQITDKGGSWIGPLFATFVSNILNLRYTMLFLLFFYIFAIPLLHCVDYDEGMVESSRINKRKEENISESGYITYLKDSISQINANVITNLDTNESDLSIDCHSCSEEPSPSKM